MDHIIQNLTVIPCAITNQSTQKCHLGEEELLLLGGRIGSFVRIRHHGKVLICCVWLQKTIFSGFISYDDMVYEPISDNRPQNIQRHAGIELLHPGITDILEVSIIAADVPSTELLRKRTYAHKLEHHCKTCLMNICVTSNCIVDLRKHKLGQAYKISYIKIHSFNCTAVIINKEMKLNVTQIKSRERFEQEQEETEIIIAGVDTTVKTLIEIINLPFKYPTQVNALGINLPKGILLRGPPGCGKTTLVRHVAKMCGAHLVTINGPEIFGSRPGESEENLRKVFQKATTMCKEGPCILFIDEIDSLCPARDRASSGQEGRVTGQLMNLMDGLQSRETLIVIGATNRPSAIDPNLRRPGRFDKEILLNIPTLKQRRHILEVHTSRLPLAESLDLDILADITNGYAGADLASLCHESAYIAMSEHIQEGAQPPRKIAMRHIREAFKRIVPSLQRGMDAVVDLRPVAWDDIGGLDAVKQKIKQAVEWPLKHPASFERLGLKVPKGLLLYGPPGCCKTTLVRAAATAVHATFLSLSGAQLYSPYVGDSEKLLAEVFQRARAAVPSILFLDELDSIVGKRSEGGQQRSVQDRILSTLLNEMDGIGIRLDEKMDAMNPTTMLESQTGQSNTQSPSAISVDNSSLLLVAATNRPDLVDEALLRPGRFDRIVYVPPPDSQARLDILRVQTRQMPLKDVCLQSLVHLTDHFTGADLDNLRREAALCALTEDGLDTQCITHEHFMKALANVKPSLTPSLIEQYKCLKSKTFKTAIK